MNRKTLCLNAFAAALLAVAGTSQAAQNPSLDNAIRLQTQDASAAIQAQLRADLHATPYVLDVPGVNVGKVRLVESETPDHGTPRPVMETTAVDVGDALRQQLAARALEVPGLFGVYRYMAAAALDVAIIVAE